jgi:hypothetical protein
MMVPLLSNNSALRARLLASRAESVAQVQQHQSQVRASTEGATAGAKQMRRRHDVSSVQARHCVRPLPELCVETGNRFIASLDCGTALVERQHVYSSIVSRIRSAITAG